MDGRVVHCKKERFDIYIGRPSKYGNPFTHKPKTKAKFKVKTREEAIEAYEASLRDYFEKYPDAVYDLLKPLKGKVLGCWCKPLPCHGDVLLKLIKEWNI